MNEIFKTLNETYNFDSNLSDTFLGKFKICEFKNGEVISKEILKVGLGQAVFDKFEEMMIVQEEEQLVQENSDNEEDHVLGSLTYNNTRRDKRIQMLMTKSIDSDDAVEELKNC